MTTRTLLSRAPRLAGAPVRIVAAVLAALGLGLVLVPTDGADAEQGFSERLQYTAGNWNYVEGEGSRTARWAFPTGTSSGSLSWNSNTQAIGNEGPDANAAFRFRFGEGGYWDFALDGVSSTDPMQTVERVEFTIFDVDGCIADYRIHAWDETGTKLVDTSEVSITLDGPSRMILRVSDEGTFFRVRVLDPNRPNNADGCISGHSSALLIESLNGNHLSRVRANNIASDGTTWDGDLLGLRVNRFGVVQEPSIDLVHTIESIEDTTGDSNVGGVGDHIIFGFVVTNTGDVHLDNVSIDATIATSIVCETTSLAPGESTYCTADPYEITAADVDRTETVDIAVATGVATDDSSVNSPERDVIALHVRSVGSQAGLQGTSGNG